MTQTTSCHAPQHNRSNHATVTINLSIFFFFMKVKISFSKYNRPFIKFVHFMLSTKAAIHKNIIVSLLSVYSVTFLWLKYLSAHECEKIKSHWKKSTKKIQIRLISCQFLPQGDTMFPEVVFLVVCDPSMNELWAT